MIQTVRAPGADDNTHNGIVVGLSDTRHMASIQYIDATIHHRHSLVFTRIYI